MCGGTRLNRGRGPRLLGGDAVGLQLRHSPCKARRPCQTDWAHTPATHRRSDRQQYFFNTAIVLLCAVLMNVACFVSSLAATLAQPDCSYPWVALAALEFVRVRRGGGPQPPLP